jgi:hypothetical protein
LVLDFLSFWTYFRVKKKKKKSVLYEPYLLLDAPVDAHFASFGVSEAGDAISNVDDNDDNAIAVAAEPVGQRGRPVGKIHERVGFWVEHFCPDAYVPGILEHGFEVPVDCEAYGQRGA